MSSNEVPSEPPPSYQQATGSSSTSQPAASTSRPTANTGRKTSHLDVPGIPAASRRSMEDESRPLPRGWVRSFDAESGHQFYVDTTKEPPRSIWVHPYDDDQYLSTLSSEERERIQEESNHAGRGHPPSKADIMASHTDEEDEFSSPTSPGLGPNELPPRPDKGKGKDSRGFGRKFKDKVTGTTHEERQEQKRQRAEAERKMYEHHQRIRQAMAEAARTGKPQLVGKDKDGKDLYIEPPAGIGAGAAYGRPYGNPYPGGGNYYNPYGPGGVYTTPNARYVRPPNPYNRPYGGGYGGGYGLPIGLGIGGGLLGGLLIGDALGGGFGGGGF